MFDRATLDRLYRYGYTLTGEPHSAFDLLQDALERFLRDDHGHVLDPSAYLRTMMRHQFIDNLRRARGAREEEFREETHLDIDTRTLEEVVIAEDQLAAVWQALQPVEREILYHWAVEGRTAREIAATLGLPRGTVLSRIHRLRQRLRALDEGPRAAAGGAS